MGGCDDVTRQGFLPLFTSSISASSRVGRHGKKEGRKVKEEEARAGVDGLL